MKFCEIIPGLLDGRRYRRPDWYANWKDDQDMSYIRMNNDMLCLFGGKDAPARFYAASRSDLKTDDWEEME